MSRITELYDVRAKAMWAYTCDRTNRKLYNSVQRADNALIDHIAANRSEHPLPLECVRVGEVTYGLQSFKKGTARYVLDADYNQDKWVYEPVLARDLVIREISAMAKINDEIQVLIDNGIDPFE